MRRAAQPDRRRYWEVLVSGEMDAERSSSAVAWWGTRGGRDMVLFGQETEQENMMSGALPPAGYTLRESKL
jgi:hypothetical protein